MNLFEILCCTNCGATFSVEESLMDSVTILSVGRLVECCMDPKSAVVMAGPNQLRIYCDNDYEPKERLVKRFEVIMEDW